MRSDDEIPYDELALQHSGPDSLQNKPQESIHEDFRQFEKSICNIDTKFSILNANLIKY